MTDQARDYTRRLDWKFAEADRLARLDPDARAAYRRLSVLRARLARDAGVRAYHVLTNRLLLELAERRPADVRALEEIPGLGRLRARAYGPEVLAVLRPPV